MRTDAELEKAVKEGAALLDVERADWAVRMDPRTLDIASPEVCALGQEFGSYMTGMEALGQVLVEGDEMLPDTDWARAHGFDSDVEAVAVGMTTRLVTQYDKLNDLWVKEIEARRG